MHLTYQITHFQRCLDVGCSEYLATSLVHVPLRFAIQSMYLLCMLMYLGAVDLLIACFSAISLFIVLSLLNR